MAVWHAFRRTLLHPRTGASQASKGGWMARVQAAARARGGLPTEIPGVGLPPLTQTFSPGPLDMLVQP